MKRINFLLIIGSIILFSACGTNTNTKQSDTNISSKNKSGLDLVNMFIGTSGQHQSEYGGMIPGVTAPFGMTQWTAMTRKNGVSSCPYHYSDDRISGFLATHQPAIWMGDYGFFSIMPQLGDIELRFAERSMSFSHENETATPYHYAVDLKSKEGIIKSELTATTRCSQMKFTFPKNEEPKLSIEVSRLKKHDGYVKIIPAKNMIIGYNSDTWNNVWGTHMGPELKNFKGYFVMQFDQKIITYGTYRDSSYVYSTKEELKVFESVNELTGEEIGAYVTFSGNTTNTLNVKIATSFISIEQAIKNLEIEIPNWDFEKTVESTKTEWKKYFDRFQIKGGTHDQQVSFYSGMYHSLLYPRVFSEHGKYYSAFDEKIHEGVSYNDYSLWDTYRALHPLLLYLAPEHVNPMITSLLQMYDESGWIPKWPNPTFSNIMIGTHADAVIADAYVKGFRDFDVNKAYEAMYKNAMTPPDGDQNRRWQDRDAWTSYEARGGLSWYKRLGYVPGDKTAESVSRTLEFAYGDYCVAQMAKSLGKNEDYKYFMKRSENFKNVYNQESGFMQTRLADGSFYTGHPWKYRSFTEGSPWTYLFCAMHDVDGLIDVMGGTEKFTEKLDENFDGGHYRHNNEPGHHYIYLYNYAGQAWKTQEKVRETLINKYQNKPDGLCGNDDCGQMSAWYIFSSMGFYPVAPGSEMYAIGAPLFNEIKINLGKPYQEKSFVIKAPNLSETNIYVQSVSLDGKKLDKPFISHYDIVKGKELIFVMGDKPNYNW